MGALAQLAARAVATFGGRALPVVRRAGLPAAAGIAGGLIPGLFGGDDGGALERPRRRRRRRVLTSNDRADIAFIVATLGPSAGKAFAMIVAART